MDIRTAGEKAIFEAIRATSLFPPFNSYHEGYAVILEELEELKAQIFKHTADRSLEKLTNEATQVAAMAIRFLVDCC